MTLKAKPVIKNKFWIVEERGKKVAAVLSNPQGYTFLKNAQHRENFSSFRTLAKKYNISVEPAAKTAPSKSQHQVHGYPCEHVPCNSLWAVKHRLPIYTKNKKSKSFFCAGYYIIKFPTGWTRAYCPKLITLQRYLYQGPFYSAAEMNTVLRSANQLISN